MICLVFNPAKFDVKTCTVVAIRLSFHVHNVSGEFCATIASPGYFVFTEIPTSPIRDCNQECDQYQIQHGAVLFLCVRVCFYCDANILSNICLF